MGIPKQDCNILESGVCVQAVFSRSPKNSFTEFQRLYYWVSKNSNRLCGTRWSVFMVGGMGLGYIFGAKLSSKCSPKQIFGIRVQCLYYCTHKSRTHNSR